MTKSELCVVDEATETRIVSHGKHRKQTTRTMQKCFRKQYATVIWVVRDMPLAEQFVSYVTSLAAFCTHHHVDVPFVVKLYFTSGGDYDLSKMMTNALAAIEFNTLAAAAGGNALDIHFGRPNFEAALREAGGADTYYCGPPRFGETIAAACSKHVMAPLCARRASKIRLLETFGRTDSSGRRKGGGGGRERGVQAAMQTLPCHAPTRLTQITEQPRQQRRYLTTVCHC